MAKILRMPKIGVNMTDGRVVQWLVKEGDRVSQGDVILTAETDKAVQEIEATDGGRIAKILVPEEETAECQQPIAVLAEADEDISGLMAELVPGAARGVSETVAAADPAQVSGRSGNSGRSDEDAGNILIVETPAYNTPGSRVRISPLARKTARDLGIDFNRIPPKTGGARVVKRDVLAFAKSGPSDRAGGIEPPCPSEASAPSEKPASVGSSESAGIHKEALSSDSEPLAEGDRLIPLTPIRRVIAERMSKSANTVPQAVLTVSVEASNLVARRKRYGDGGRPVGYSSLIIEAAARALRSFPIMNSGWTDAGIRLPGRVNIGIAVDTENGLLVPVIQDADRKGVVRIHRELHEMAARARAGKASSADLSGGTFTITNLGGFGIDEFVPLVNPPQCAILALGRIRTEALFDDDSATFIPVPMLKLTLAFDHRVTDGGPAARFLSELKLLLEQPPEMKAIH